MTSATAPSRWRRRPAAVLLALSAIAVTVVAAVALRPVRLAEVLLIVLVEVIGVSLVAGRAVAAATAIGAFVAVNWLLVPPYGTLQVQNQENWITLAVFLILAVGVSTLVESVLASERAAAGSAAREAALADALRPESASAGDALHVLRTALHLESAALVEAGTGTMLVGTEPALPTTAPVLRVDVAPGYQVRGWGDPILGSQPEYVATLATAVARAWDSEQLVAEQERSARLAEVDAARAALLATIGHDLRTPLAGIRVSVDALAMSGADLSADDQRELLDGLRQSAVRLDGLIGAVLDASRFDTGSAVAHPVPTDVRDVLAAALVDFDSPRVQLEVPGDRALGAVVDPTLLERIVANLVANALAHTPPDSPVQVTGQPEGGGVRVTVADHGAGLDTDSVDVGRSNQGMGLLIVDRLAAYAGIGVSRSETPGGGLSVVLRIGGGS